jgi:hypothetical protein
MRYGVYRKKMVPGGPGPTWWPAGTGGRNVTATGSDKTPVGVPERGASEEVIWNEVIPPAHEFNRQKGETNLLVASFPRKFPENLYYSSVYTRHDIQSRR